MSMPPTGPESQGAGAPPPYGQPSDAPPPAYGGAPAPGYSRHPPLSDSDRRLWAMLAHLSGIILSFVGPLVVWLIYKDRDEFVKDQSTEALNFQITVFIAGAICGILSLIVIGIILAVVVGITALVLMIMAALAANKGERYRYPFALRLIK